MALDQQKSIICSKFCTILSGRRTKPTTENRSQPLIFAEPELLKFDTGKLEFPKFDTGKLEFPKFDTGKLEFLKFDIGKPEFPKFDTGKPEMKMYHYFYEAVKLNGKN